MVSGANFGKHWTSVSQSSVDADPQNRKKYKLVTHVVLRKSISMAQSELLRPTSLWVPNATRRRLPII